MNYKSKSGKIITIPDGASKEQIARVKAFADLGQDGKAQQEATRVVGKGKGNSGGTGSTTQNPDPGEKGTGNAYNAADAFVQSLIDKMQPLDLSKAPKLLSDGDIQAERKSVYDSNYQLQTQGVEQNRARDLEQQKQDLANRGIPYDPSTSADDPNNVNNVYARSLNSVNQRYDTINSNAAAAANSAADSGVSTLVGANKTQNDQYVQNQTADFQSQLDALSGGTSLLNTLMQKYGIDADTAKSILAAKTSTRIAQINNQRSGGGGGSGGGSGGGGFNVPGTGGTVS